MIEDLVSEELNSVETESVVGNSRMQAYVSEELNSVETFLPILIAT